MGKQYKWNHRGGFAAKAQRSLTCYAAGGGIHYSRAGYAWVNGHYVKVNPKASGITHTYGSSRADEREERHSLDHPGKGHIRREGSRPQSQRAKAKAAARERFERNRALTNQRMATIRSDRRANRARREAMSFGR